jgi:hypothetical protein
MLPSEDGAALELVLAALELVGSALELLPPVLPSSTSSSPAPHNTEGPQSLTVNGIIVADP